MTDPSNLSGQTVGRYQILEHLGQGGMAEVYRAYQPSLDRFVAIKILHAFLAREEGFIGRFEREAKNVAALRHPNIIQVHDFDVHNGMPYMVMEYIEGGTLKTYLEGRDRLSQPLPLAEAIRIAREVGRALAYAHERSMIHRDVKPANVLLDKDGRVILTDFGIAKLLTGPSFTATGAIIGTPAYMAPEQSLGEAGDHRSDVYALGVMLYQLSTGQLPFDADTPLAIMHKHVHAPLPPPRSLRPDLPAALERLILKSMAKRPTDRIQSAGELVAQLDSLAGTTVPRTPAAVPRPAKRPPPSATLIAPGAVPGRWSGRSGWLYAALALAAALVLCLTLGWGALALRDRLGALNSLAASPTAPASSTGTAALTRTPPAATRVPSTQAAVAPAACLDPLGCLELAPGQAIHLAYALAVEGPESYLGQDALRSIGFALDDHAGQLLGHPLELTGVDTGCSAEGGQAAAEKLAADPTIVAVIGPSCSSAARSAAPVLSEAGFTLVSPASTAPDLTDPATHAAGFLRTAHNDEAQGAAAAEYAFQVLGVQRAATLHDDSNYSQQLAQAFAERLEALGGTIVAQAAVAADGSDAVAALNTAAAAQPQLIYFPVYVKAGGSLVARARGVPGLEQVVLMGADAMFSPELLPPAGAAVVGLKLSGPDFLRYGSAYADFVARYQTQFGTPPLSPYHAHAYDATNMILAAVEKVAVPGPGGALLIGRQALRDALFATQDFAGLTGRLTCTATGDCGNALMAVYDVVDQSVWAPGAGASSNPRLAWRPGMVPGATLTGKVCLAAESGGVDDKAFNANIYAGVLLAQQKFGWETAVLEAQQPSDYALNIETFLKADCSLIVGAGSQMSEAIEAAARANPEQRFQIFDQAYEPAYANVWTDTYAVDQAAFLAGYLAAGVSPTGRVGTYGGFNVTPVVAFMDGFALGVDYYNQQHGAIVELLGWDPANRAGGLFLDNFTDTGAAQGLTNDLLAKGADVIFPVAGSAGYGSAAAVREHGAAYVIGVDTDWVEAAPEYEAIVLTSVLKRVDVSVLSAVSAITLGEFQGGNHLGTLANGGVGLAPFHELDALVSAELKADLERIQTMIINGEIQTAP